MTSAIDIERRLRERYRQPAGVEQFGIERRIGHRRGARENDRHHLSADPGQRDLRIDPGVRRGDRLRIAQGADARRLADEGHRVGLSICSVRAS